MLKWFKYKAPALKKKVKKTSADPENPNDRKRCVDEASERASGVTSRAADDDPSLLMQVSRRAMATEFVVMLPAREADAVETVVMQLEQLDSIEQSLTIYRDDSEISRVNRLASHELVELTKPTFELLERAITWSKRTLGAFDITAGPLVDVWGFTRRSGRKPQADEINAALRLVGYQHIELDPNQRTAQFSKSGMSINLGAIGKGEALDRIASSLNSHGLTDFLIHGGNSSVLARGDQIAGSGMGWAVGLAHPTKAPRRIAGLWLKDKAIATSGSGKQFFHHRGRRYGHVIDPRTGYPAGDLLSLTVLMDSAADADACATGLYVAGSQAITEFAAADWLPPLVTVRQASQQDGVEVGSVGDVPWAEAPSDFGIPGITSGD